VSDPTGAVVRFVLDGRPVEAPDDGGSLLDALRESLGVRSVKDGCAPQGQCGCCTVLVDGAPRVACVTPLRRIADRTVTTVDGLDPARRDRWAAALCATGGSQCGFCTPGIVLRLDAEAAGERPDPERALLAHLCRCTGWTTILEAYALVTDPSVDPAVLLAGRDLGAAARRAAIEGAGPQQVGLDVPLGRAPFAEDTAPADATVAMRAADGTWVTAATPHAARRLAGVVPGRHGTLEAVPPLAVPPVDAPVTLRTSWVDPAYLEPDASWCEPGGVPASPVAAGGAFGGKTASPLPEIARGLAAEVGRPVRARWSREDVVRLGPKRPPVAASVDPVGRTAHVAVVRTPGVVDRIRAGFGAVPGVEGWDVEVTEVDVPGPPTSTALRTAGWAEGVVLASSAVDVGPITVRTPQGAEATVEVHGDGTIEVVVRCGDPLDEVVVRSYAIGAAHMALSWVTSEALAVGADGVPLGLTVRSAGVVRAVDMPTVRVVVEVGTGEPLPVSDAVFAAVAAAVWRHQGRPECWPTGRPVR